jgi:hypothetical protein
VKKLVAVSAGSAALATMGFLFAGHASSDTLDVTGITYAQAVQVLKSQGYMVEFQGSVGGDVPQSQCVVASQKMLPHGWVSVMLNCTRAAQAVLPAANPNAPVVGGNGVTTVKATPVAPPPQELAPQPPPFPGGNPVS